jgi:hypothetical protein
MPWKCAKAVCATFCYKIAGALIPLFGPDFPSQCIHPETTGFGHMSISPLIVQEATLEAERYRREQHIAESTSSSTLPPSLRNPESPSNHRRSRSARNTPERGAHLTRDYGLGLMAHGRRDNPYIADDGRDMPASARSASLSRGYLHSPGEVLPSLPLQKTSAWTPANRVAREGSSGASHLGDPHLSAVPRRLPLPNMPTSPALPYPNHRSDYPPRYQHSFQGASTDHIAGNHQPSLSYPPPPVLPLPRLPSMTHPDSPTWPRGSPTGTKRPLEIDSSLLRNAGLPSQPRNPNASGLHPADAEQDRSAALQLLKLGLLDRVREERMREKREKELRAGRSSPQQQGHRARVKNCNFVRSVAGAVESRRGAVTSDNRRDATPGHLDKTENERYAEMAMAMVDMHQRKRHRASSEGEIGKRGVVGAREQVV